MIDAPTIDMDGKRCMSSSKERSDSLFAPQANQPAEIGTATLLVQIVQKISPQNATPSEGRGACIKSKLRRKAHAVPGGRRQGVRGPLAHLRIEAEEMCTKIFRNRFKQKGRRNTIQEQRLMTGVHMTRGAESVGAPEEIPSGQEETM